jgi:hypothetical protein
MNQARLEARQATVRCKPELPKPLSRVQRYDLAVLSVSVALGGALLLERFHFRDVEVPLFLFAVAVAAWYGETEGAVLAASTLMHKLRLLLRRAFTHARHLTF